MRIATWNLQSDEPLPQRREALFRQAINTVHADVWVLTETWEHFSPGESYRLAAESSLADDLRAWPDRRWVAIWATSTLEAKRQPVQGQPDRMACAQIKKPGQRESTSSSSSRLWSVTVSIIGRDVASPYRTPAKNEETANTAQTTIQYSVRMLPPLVRCADSESVPDDGQVRNWERLTGDGRMQLRTGGHALLASHRATKIHMPHRKRGVSGPALERAQCTSASGSSRSQHHPRKRP